MSHLEALTSEQYEAALALAQRRLQRSDRAREQAELMLELRSRALSIANANLRRRESELLAKLEQDAQRLIAAQETAHMASFHVEQSARVVGSPNLSRIIGSPQTIAVLDDIINAIHPLEPKDTLSFLRGDGLTPDGRQRDIRFIERTGGARWLRWSLRPVPDVAGSYQGVVQNITENRRLTRQLRHAEILRARQFVKLERLSSELAEKSAMLSDRVAELERLGATLEEARNRAIHADRAKSQFLAMMSHDIRTPMNAILAVTDILATSPLDAAQQNWLNLIRTSGEQMLFLLSDIIEVARHQEIDIKLNPGPIDLHEFLNTIAATWRPLARLRQLDLACVFTDQLVRYVRVDAVRLRQVFDNLISNAIKYTDRGVIAITARGDCDAPDCALVFGVADTGPGIGPDHLESIFEVGHRVTSDLNEFVQGSGLGLAICSKIIAAMSGRISVDSHLGAGSTFTVVIPCDPCTPGEYEAYTHATAAHLQPLAPTARRRILVAEDVEANRTIIAGLLDQLGHDYDLVEDGIAAVEHAARRDYDLILMDVQMPRLNGMRATQAIRAMTTPISAAPIIGLTAFVADTERAAMLRAGMTAVVCKPVRLASLAAAIAEHGPVTARPPTPADDAGAPSPTADLALIDIAFFDEQISPFPAARRTQLVAAMVADLHRLKRELLDAYIAGDDAALAQARHALVGLCHNFGLTALADCVMAFGGVREAGYKATIHRLESVAARSIVATELLLARTAVER